MSTVTYLDLRKELNLTLKQFKTKLSCIGLEFKESYNESEVKQLKDFIALNLNRNELRELPYTKKGWIPIRVMPSELQCSKNTILSYIGKLNLNIYKPIHQLSFISQDDFNKLKDFVFQFNSTNERKLYLEKQTCLEKYGVENPSQSENAKEKISVISKENAKERLEKAKQTCIEKYGVENIFASKEFREQMNQTKEEVYKKGYSPKVLSKMFNRSELTISHVTTRLGIKKEENNYVYIEFNDLPILQKYFETTEMSSVSYGEKEILDFIKSIYNGEIKENNRDIIYPKELDIYIPEKKVAIEFDGVYWHNEMFRDSKYHLNKTLECEKKGIRLLHIFEDEWNNKQEIVKSIIASSLGIYTNRIYARKCEVRNVNNRDAINFLENNHIQGSINRGTNLGLYYNNELVQIISYGASRFKKNEVELYRMCTKLNTQVIGGFSKLLSKLDVSNLISYIDRRLFNGNGYKASNWKLLGYTSPSYFYIVEDKRENRLNWQKNKLADKLEYFDPSLSEHENMLNNGLYRIYDCGTIKVQLNKKDL